MFQFASGLQQFLDAHVGQRALGIHQLVEFQGRTALVMGRGAVGGLRAVLVDLATVQGHRELRQEIAARHGDVFTIGGQAALRDGQGQVVLDGQGHRLVEGHRLGFHRIRIADHLGGTHQVVGG